MKNRRMARGAVVVIIPLALALAFQPLSRSAFAASQEVLAYKGGPEGVSSSCGASNYETCPPPSAPV